MKRLLYREPGPIFPMWPSALALFFGWIIFFSGCARLAAGTLSESSFSPFLGLQIILGTSAYRSKKRRKLGIKSESDLREACEILYLGLAWFPNIFLVLSWIFSPLPELLFSLRYNPAVIILPLVVTLWPSIAYLTYGKVSSN